MFLHACVKRVAQTQLKILYQQSLLNKIFCSCHVEVSGEWAEDQTNRASLVTNTRAGRVKADLEKRGRTGDPLESAVSRSPLRRNLREVESSP